MEKPGAHKQPWKIAEPWCGVMKGKVRGRAKPPLVMRKELTQEMVTYGTDLLCPGLPIQNSLYPQLRAVHGTATFIFRSGIWWNCCSAFGWWWQFYHSLAREMVTGTASAKALPFAAPRLYVEPLVSTSLKLRTTGLLVRTRQKSLWALNTPQGNLEYLKGKHNGKSFGSSMRNKLVFAE